MTSDLCAETELKLRLATLVQSALKKVAYSSRARARSVEARKRDQDAHELNWANSLCCCRVTLGERWN